MRVENQPDMSVLVSSIQGYKKGKMTRKVSVFLDKGIDISTEAFEEVTTLPPVAEAKTGEFYILPDGSVNYISGGTWKTIALTLYSEPGSNTDGAMTQKAVSETLFTDPDGQTQVRIGKSAFNSAGSGVAIGDTARVTGANAVSIGRNASSGSVDGVAIGLSANAGGSGTPNGAIAIGRQSSATAVNAISLGGASVTTQGVMSIAVPGGQEAGYNSTDYRLLTGVHDGASAHDAATYGQLDTRMGGLTILTITQAAYDQLQDKDAHTLYVITGA